MDTHFIFESKAVGRLRGGGGDGAAMGDYRAAETTLRTFSSRWRRRRASRSHADTDFSIKSEAAGQLRG